MPKVSDEHRQAMRERIHTAALESFLRKGVTATSMADILGASGLSAGAFYGYFKSKDELVAEVASELVGGRLHAVDSFLQQHTDAEPPDVIRALVESIPPELFTTGLLVEVWALVGRDETIRDNAHRAVGELRNAFVGYLTEYGKRQGMTAEHAATWATNTSLVLLGLCQGYIVQATLLGHDVAQQYLRGLEAVRLHP